MRTPRLRLLSALLAVALFFTLLPVSALAEDSGSNANTGLTIGIVGEFNNWDVSDITMKEVSPAVYEVTIENTSYDEINTSYDEINDLPGFKFIKDHTYADQWGSSVTASSGELHDAVYYGDNIMIDPGSDDESAVRNFIVRLDLTNWDWGTITGATFTITVTAPSRDFTFDATTGTIKKYNGNDAVVNIPSEINGTPVTTIGNAAFRDSSVTSVTIPASVTEIGKLTAPTVEGYTFDGWYADADYTTEFDFSTPITGDTKIYAKWTANDYYVSFVTEHGAPPTSQNVKYNGTATDPGKLTAEGYTFIGWYTDETYTKEFDFTKPITSNTTVYAKWEKNAPVLPDTYALNVSGAFVYVDGVDVTASAGDTTLQLEKDASVRLVADPDRMPSGMVFDRWTILNGALNADDAEKFETGRTLEEFAFTMPAEPLSIEATPRMQEEEGSDTVSVIAGVTLGTAATALVAWQAYDLGMSLYQEHWLPADFVMPKTRAELALLLWNTAGRPAPAAQPAFTDITDPDTAQAAQWAVETGLMTPKSADRFKPEKSVTRWKAVRSWKRVTNQNT